MYAHSQERAQKGTNVRMRKNHRLAVLLMAVMMLLSSVNFAALAEEEEAPVTHIAQCTVALKVRSKPADNAGGRDSIPRGSFVYIIEYDDEWCKVRTDRVEGYIKTKYLTDIREQAGAAQQEDGAEAPVAAVQPTGEGFTMTEDTFEEKFIAHTVKDYASVYAEPAENSRRRTQIKIYKKVIVGEVQGDWCYVCYNGNVYGYMRTDSLFKWDRIDPYAGDIPGLEIWPYMAFVNKSTLIKDISTGEELVTVNPGSAISVGEKDSFGRYPLPYPRTTGYINEEDIAYVMPVVPWDEAESGDLISVMTTFFAVGKSTLQYQGRNWNIHLSSAFISGTVLQPGEKYNQYHVIGPYRKSTGYHSAPIMSGEKLAGYGGGTCQTNTTFYITVMQVPLLVTHRKVHAEVGMYYAEKGFDAAVGGGDINLTMENSLPYPVRFQFFNSDGVLTCCVFKE